ncbi:MAG: T9SS type A sorting domain-containing protein [Fidelibacterota bacterium]
MTPSVKNRKEQEGAVLMIYLVFIAMIHFSQVYSQSVPFDTLSVNTATMHINLTSIGKLEWQISDIGIYWRGGDVPFWVNTVIFDHGLWMSGYNQDTLRSSASSWGFEYSQGPIINGEAAMVTSPEDSLLYRIYHIDHNSAVGDVDYNQWPVQWGAPHTAAGEPKVIGEQTSFMIYNDAHPSPELLGWPESSANPIEIHETVWDYGNADSLANVIFFRYQIFNRGNYSLDDFILGLWTDIDLYPANGNRGGYNVNGDYMFIYSPHDYISGVKPRACAYIMLQGPLISSPGNTGHFFGQTIPDTKNLPLLSGWTIHDDSDTFGNVGSYPANAEEQRNIMAGLMPDGSPILNPVTGETTTFTYDGNPMTNEGWLWTAGGGGGAGFLSNSGPFNFAAGDSNEVIFAMISIVDTSYENALVRLENQALWLRTWWDTHWNVGTGNAITLPSGFNLHQNYPNPFNPVTTIRYELPEQTSVKLAIYDILGQEVAVLVDEQQAPGIREVEFDARNLASDIYFYRLSTPTFTQTRKLVILK